MHNSVQYDIFSVTNNAILCTLQGARPKSHQFQNTQRLCEFDMASKALTDSMCDIMQGLDLTVQTECLQPDSSVAKEKVTHYTQQDEAAKYTEAQIAAINHRRALANIAIRRILPYKKGRYAWLPQTDDYVVPAAPRGFYRKYSPTPDVKDPRWTIWTVGRITTPAMVNTVGIKLDILREVLRRTDADAGVAVKKRSKVYAAELLAQLAARRERLAPPDGWSPDAFWWEHLPETHVGARLAPTAAEAAGAHAAPPKKRRRITRGQQHQRSLVLYQPEIKRQEEDNVARGVYALGDNSEMFINTQIDAAGQRRAEIISASVEAAYEEPKWKRPINRGGVTPDEAEAGVEAVQPILISEFPSNPLKRPGERVNGKNRM